MSVEACEAKRIVGTHASAAIQLALQKQATDLDMTTGTVRSGLCTAFYNGRRSQWISVPNHNIIQILHSKMIEQGA
ncbi:MAG: hypothetical protein K0R57_587 [Paenibacillaceae bacterium]|jgi:hypothetical protein|nr:hypothetical protein [Paenibacillaceae bacterium]